MHPLIQEDLDDQEAPGDPIKQIMLIKIELKTLDVSSNTARGRLEMSQWKNTPCPLCLRGFQQVLDHLLHPVVTKREKHLVGKTLGLRK